MVKKRMAVFLFIAIFIESFVNQVNAEPIKKPPELSVEELYQDMLISLMLNDIQHSVESYYSEFIKIKPLVYPYQVDIMEAKRVYGYRSFRFLIKIQVTPVVGPHISVGRDFITFDISGTGKVRLKDYMHIQSFKLPRNWQHILINKGIDIDLKHSLIGI